MAVYIVMMKYSDTEEHIASIFSAKEKAEKYIEIQSHYDYGVEFYIEQWRVN